RKNVLVGVTVLIALILLGIMILRFSDAPFQLFAKPQIHVVFKASSAEGLGEGSPVYYLGVNIGRVARVSRTHEDVRGQARDVVLIRATLEKEPALPANVEGLIRTQLIGGGSSILLALIPLEIASLPPLERPVSRPATTRPIEPVGQLSSGQTLGARFVGADILPQEISDLASGLTRTNEQLQLVIQEINSAHMV